MKLVKIDREILYLFIPNLCNVILKCWAFLKNKNHSSGSSIFSVFQHQRSIIKRDILGNKWLCWSPIQLFLRRFDSRMEQTMEGILILTSIMYKYYDKSAPESTKYSISTEHAVSVSLYPFTTFMFLFIEIVPVLH